MRLSALLSDGAAVVPDVSGGADDPEITGITADSRKVVPGTLFAALPGTRVDGAKFAGAAAAAGASAVLAGSDARLDLPPGIAVVRAADPHRQLALLAARFHAPQPEFAVAVTGTNGKTSVASFTEQIWHRLGLRSGSVGTLGVSASVDLPDALTTEGLTSPDPVTLHRTLQGMAQAGVTHIALEASSHGLAQRRVDGVRLAGGAFTNISRDHLDYHPTFEDYLDQKLRLFRQLLPEGARAVIHADAQGGDAALAVAREKKLETWTMGRSVDADLRLIEITPLTDGLALRLGVDGAEHRYSIPLIGAFQAENAVQAAALAASDNRIGLLDALKAMEHLKGAMGRLEHAGRKPGGGDIYIDYSHTPDALATALQAIRPHTSGRLIVVFGAGGDRDPGKRPLMGAAAHEHADSAIVTDDNPRNEDPGAIRRAVMDGAPDAVEIGDRADAIAAGIDMLTVGDVLLVAGKGHEAGQTVKGRVIPFLDHDAVRDALNRNGSS